MSDWTGKATLIMLRRQVAELDETRAELIADPDAKPADDNPELMSVILELRVLSKMADDIASGLVPEKNYEESKDEI